MKHEISIRESAKLKPGSLGRLYDLLDESLPNHRTRINRLNILQLSRDLQISSQAMYRWFDKDKITPSKVNTLIELSDGKLTFEALAPFILK